MFISSSYVTVSLAEVVTGENASYAVRDWDRRRNDQLKVVLVATTPPSSACHNERRSVEHGPGTAEQDAVVMWAQLVDAVRELTTAQPARPPT